MKYRVIAFVLILFSISSCVQLKELARFTQCDFDFESVNKVKLANINIENISNYQNLGMGDVARLLAAFSSGNLPLTFNVNIDAKNPNSQQASLSRLDWIAMIDDLEVANGAIRRRIVIPANSNTTITLPVSVNLMELLKGKNQSTILNFGMNLAGKGNEPSRVKVKIKPSVNIAGQTIQSPSYITLTKKVSN